MNAAWPPPTGHPITSVPAPAPHRRPTLTDTWLRTFVHLAAWTALAAGTAVAMVAGR